MKRPVIHFVSPLRADDIASSGRAPTASGLGSGPLVSVIVACRNERQHIEQFLNSVLRQAVGLPWELIVAEGMSNDGTREILETYQDRFSNLRIVENQGKIVSAGLNAAIKEAQGEYIIRMDVHSEYSPDYIIQCLRVLHDTGADNVGGAARPTANGFWAEAIAAAYASPFSCGGARFHQQDYEGWVDTVPYGCWRITTFEDLGLFDETLVRNQDDEMNLRITRAGGRIWQSRSVVSWYWSRESVSALFRQYFQYGFWKVAVMRKHRVVPSWRHIVPGLFVALNLILAGAGLAAVLTGCPGIITVLRGAALLEASLYGTACLIASVYAVRGRSWHVFPMLPLIFAAYHVSYGAGFLVGLCFLPLRRLGLSGSLRVFTKLSR